MTAPEAVFVHGMWGGAHVWRHIAPAFAEAGFHVRRPTLRHHAVRPDRDPPTAIGTIGLQDYASDLEGMIGELPAPPLLIGHSMGALLAQIVATRIPVRGLILLNPAPCRGLLPIYPSAMPLALRILLTWKFWQKPHRLNLEESREYLFNCLSEEEQRAEHDRCVWESGRALFEIALWFLDRGRASAIDPQRVLCPVMVLAGQQDYLTPPALCRKIAGRYGSQAEYWELRDHAHWLPGEPGTAEVAQMCLDWSRRHGILQNGADG